VSYFDFFPYEYKPQMAGSAVQLGTSASMGQEAQTSSSSSRRGGSVTLVSRDVRIALDMTLVSVSRPEGRLVVVQEAFLCFPGDATCEKMLLLVSFPNAPEKGLLKQPLVLPYKFRDGGTFNVRVVQRDPSNGEEAVIYPNTRYTQVTGKVDVVEPTASVEARKPLYLVVASNFPFVTGGEPLPGWNGDGAAPQTPLEFSPLRLQVTIPLLVSSVA